jgi:predicted nucleotidyltransferase
MANIPDDVRTSVEEFVRQLNANNLRILQAYIFGSYAKGRQTEWSDIDLALVSDKFEGNFYYDRRKLSPFVVKINADIETHPFRPEDFTKDNSLVEEIIETGIRIV